MSRSAQIAVALGVLCALLVGVIVGARMGSGSESERFYSRANRTLDAIAPNAGVTDLVKVETPEKNRLMNEAKEIGRAALECAADSGNDSLPGPDAYIVKVSPYMPKDHPNRLEAFDWTYKGGRQDVLGVEETNGTELGRLHGVTGDAVVYLNSRAAWKRKQP